MRPLRGLVVKVDGLKKVIETESGRLLTTEANGLGLYDRVQIHFDFTKGEARNISPCQAKEEPEKGISYLAEIEVEGYEPCYGEYYDTDEYGEIIFFRVVKEPVVL